MQEINKDKLPIKYYLGVYPSLPNFPTNEDILFEVTSDKNIINNLAFDYKYIKYLLSFKISKERFEEFINFYIEEKIIVKETSTFYKLVRNIW